MRLLSNLKFAVQHILGLFGKEEPAAEKVQIIRYGKPWHRKRARPLRIKSIRKCPLTDPNCYASFGGMLNFYEDEYHTR